MTTDRDNAVDEPPAYLREGALSYEEARRIRALGVRFVLHLNIDDDQYVRIGEPDTDLVLSVGPPDLSRALFRLIAEFMADGKIVDVGDEAARAVSWFLGAGEDRQAFMADFMEGLATHKTGSDNDPMLGYMDRAAALEAQRAGDDADN